MIDWNDALNWQEKLFPQESEDELPETLRAPYTPEPDYAEDILEACGCHAQAL